MRRRSSCRRRAKSAVDYYYDYDCDYRIVRVTNKMGLVTILVAVKFYDILLFCFMAQ